MKQTNLDVITEKKGGSRRDIIKNIAIIFLAVMLVLTFFSNTVMNMSLPQVSTQSADKGNISEQIRGSGSVTAGQSYNVNVDETRVISGVNVKAGDTVQKGDVIYTLEGKESTELADAEKSLSDMQYEYRKAVIAAGGDTGYLAELDEIENAEDDIADMKRDLERFDDPVYLSEKYAGDYLEISQLNSDISEQKAIISPDYEGLSDPELELMASDLEAAVACLDTDDFSPLPAPWYDKLTSAQDKVKSFENTEKDRLEEKKTKYEGYIAALDTEDMLGLPPEYYNKISGCIIANEDAKAALADAEEDLKEIQGQVDGSSDMDDSIKAKNREISQKNDELNEINLQILNNPTMSSEEMDALYKKSREVQREIVYLQEDLADLVEKSNLNSSIKTKYKIKQNTYNKAKKAADAAEDELTKLKREIKKELAAELGNIKTELEQYSDDDTYKEKQAAEKELSTLKHSAKSELKTKLTAVNRETEARKTLAEKETTLQKTEAAFKVKLADDKKAMEDSLKEKERSCDTLKTNLSVKKITDGVEDRQAQEDLNKKAEDIEKQKEKIAELKEKALGGTITAPVSGTVSSLSYKAGETTAAGSPAAVIDMTDKGFTLSFSVKMEQARKLTVGTNAEVANNYFGSDITAKLTAIKTDTSNPQTAKLLEFTVTGDDVKVGDTVSLTIGAKGQEYPSVVPNSAVREDSNGKYVLVVESKSSALGSRYFAVRYAVDVLAKNDSRSAVSGLTGGEFIITASSAPIEEGQQVKLADDA